MKSTLFAFAAGAVISASLGAHAAPLVTETINGVIAGQNTTDAAGYFGPAGANLSGSLVKLKFAYVPADYNTQGVCAHNYPCKTYEAYGTQLVSKAVKISATINAHTVSFSPTISSLITIFTDGSDLLLINADPGNSATNAGIQVALTFASQPIFGAALSPANPPLAKYRGDLLEIFPPNSQAANEILTFTVKSSGP